MEVDRWCFGHRSRLGAPGGPTRANPEKAGPIDHFVSEWSLPPLPDEGRALFPAVDVLNQETEVVIWVDLPGLDRAEVDITIQGGRLALRGERKRLSEAPREEYSCCERWAGRFDRGVFLPPGVAPETLTAMFRNGLLEVRVSKAERTRRETPVGFGVSAFPGGDSCTKP